MGQHAALSGSSPPRSNHLSREYRRKSNFLWDSTRPPPSPETPQSLNLDFTFHPRNLLSFNEALPYGLPSWDRCEQVPGVDVQTLNFIEEEEVQRLILD